jgi:hypothetical protein
MKHLSKFDIILIVTSILLLINIYLTIFTDFYKTEINGGSFKMHTLNYIYDVNYDSLTIESVKAKHRFTTIDQLNKAIEVISEKDVSPKAVADYIDWGIESSYIYAEIYPIVDTNCVTTDPIGEVVLKYSGPNYGENAEEDIDLQLGLLYDKYDFSLQCDKKVFTMYSVYGDD